jgi:hypothetical protein
MARNSTLRICKSLKLQEHHHVNGYPVPYASSGKAAAQLVRPPKKDVVALKKKVEEILVSQQQRVFVAARTNCTPGSQ